jgi:hypothetical protein
VLVNATPPRLPLLDLYEKEGAAPVLVDEAALEGHGVEVVVADLLDDGELIRHDSAKLAGAVLAQVPPTKVPPDQEPPDDRPPRVAAVPGAR